MSVTRREFVAGVGAAAALTGLMGFPAGALAQGPTRLGEAGPLGDLVLGEETAPVTVIEYMSMTCPHCQNFHLTTFDAFKEKYIDTGKVRFIMREFPLDPRAAAASVLARCAPNDRSFEMIALLFETQPQWAYSDDPVTVLLNLAKQTGFTEESFNACLTNQAILDGVNWNRDRGVELGVNATPTFFINGRKESGAFGMAEWDELLTPML